MSGWHRNRLNFYSSIASLVLANVHLIRLVKILPSGIWLVKNILFPWRSCLQRHIVNWALPFSLYFVPLSILPPSLSMFSALSADFSHVKCVLRNHSMEWLQVTVIWIVLHHTCTFQSMFNMYKNAWLINRVLCLIVLVHAYYILFHVQQLQCSLFLFWQVVVRNLWHY